MIMGQVKFNGEAYGFGFTQPEEGGPDVFINAIAVERAGPLQPVEGQKVSFETATDRGPGTIAVRGIEVN